MKRLPTDQHYFTTAELHAHSLTTKAIRTLVAAGRLHRITRGLYSRARPSGREVIGALRHLRPDIVLTGMTAVQLSNRMPVSLPVQVLVPRNQKFSSTHLITVIRADHRPSEEINGRRIATALRTALDVPADRAQYATMRLEHHYTGRHAREDLERDLRSWKKVPALLRERINLACIGADSDTERTLFRALRKRGYLFTQNMLVGHYFRDGVHERSKVIVEVNGYDHHHDRETMIRDYWKANDAVTRGYRHLTFSETCVDMHVDEVADFIVAVIEGRAEEIERLEEWHGAWTHPEFVGAHR